MAVLKLLKLLIFFDRTLICSIWIEKSFVQGINYPLWILLRFITINQEQNSCKLEPKTKYQFLESAKYFLRAKYDMLMLKLAVKMLHYTLFHLKNYIMIFHISKTSNLILGIFSLKTKLKRKYFIGNKNYLNC